MDHNIIRTVIGMSPEVVDGMIGVAAGAALLVVFYAVIFAINFWDDHY
jgi:hypothetical protein